MRLSLSTTLMAAALAMTIGAGQAQAAAMLWFSVDGGLPVTCSDGAVCDITAPGDGVVAYSGALGGVYGVNVTTGVSKPVLYNAMDLNSVVVQSLAAGAHTLEIRFSDDGFTYTPASTQANFGGTVSANGSTVRYQTYFDSGNALNTLTSLATDTGLLSGPAYSGVLSGPGSVTGPYSLTQVLNLSTTAVGTSFSGNFELQVVPEPASMFLLGSGLFGLAGAVRRRAKK